MRHIYQGGWEIFLYLCSFFIAPTAFHRATEDAVGAGRVRPGSRPRRKGVALREAVCGGEATEVKSFGRGAGLW